MGISFLNSRHEFLQKLLAGPAGPVPVIILTAVLMAGCNGPGNKGNTSAAKSLKEIVKKDTTYIFNGVSLDGWEITNFGPQGPVYVSGDEIILGIGDGCTGITYKKPFPETDYRVTLEAKRISGNDFFCGMTFPVGKDPSTLIIGGWGGAVVGLSSINGNDASENETTILMDFTTDRWYNICLEVSDDSIKASIDNKPVVRFAIDDKLLSIRPEVELSKPFGIASWRTTAALRNIRVEMIK